MSAAAEGFMSDQILETVIERAFLELSAAHTPALRRSSYKTMQLLIKRRSDERVVEMEREQGLA